MSKYIAACGSCRIVANRANPLRVCELEYSVVGLNPDQFFQGYVFVTYKRHETELYHLPKKARVGFLEDMVKTARALDHVFRPDKMNYSLLGNIGAAKGSGGHLHWHLTPRYREDRFWVSPHSNNTKKSNSQNTNIFNKSSKFGMKSWVSQRLTS